MSQDNLKILFRIFNVWLAFVLLLVISSNFPYWSNVELHSWINVAFYFLMVLLSGAVILRDKNNKDIFLVLMLFFLANSLTFVNFFMGDDYVFGSDSGAWKVYIYKNLLFSVLFNFLVIYSVIKYWLLKKKIWLICLLSISILIPVFVVIFYPYLTDISGAMNSDTWTKDLSLRMFFMHILSFLFLIQYFYLLYRKDKNLGEYMNLLISSFFIFTVLELIGSLSYAYGLFIYGSSQYFISINLFFISVVLMKRLLFLGTEYGKFYETLIRQKISIGKFEIKKSRNEINALVLRFLKLYLQKRWKYILSLVWILIIMYSWFRLPGFIAINVAAYLLCFAALFWFAGLLHKRRAMKKYNVF